MRRGSLFFQLYWRVLALLAALLAALLLLGFYFQGRYLYAAWQRDLREEAAWLARGWDPGADVATLARDWGEAHGAVRLTLHGPDGSVLADSHPLRRPVDLGEDGLARLLGTAPVMLPGGPATLALTREGRPAFPRHVEGLWLVLALLVAAGLSLWPVTRRLSRSFEALSGLARRVADGQFGHTLEPPAQRELAGLVASLNAMSLRLRDGELRQRRLLADVSHELRSPLGRLRALAETIGRHPAEAGPLLARVDAEVALLDRLVGDMLESARADASIAALAPRPLRPHAFLAEAAGRIRPRVEQAGATLLVEATGPDPELAADPDRLFQALGNLVENALAALAGRPDPRVTLGLEVGATGWVLSVADNGAGIAAEDLPYVFDRFYRAEAHRGHGRGRGSTGVGLGLPIAKAIAEAHGGTAGLVSEPGAGTRVTLALPRQIPTLS